MSEVEKTFSGISRKLVEMERLDTRLKKKQLFKEEYSIKKVDALIFGYLDASTSGSQWISSIAVEDIVKLN